MQTAAYLDYSERLKEALLLVRLSLGDGADSRLAAALAKSAAVLATAALERFCDDVIFQACGRLRVKEWTKLSLGQQTYFIRRISRRLHQISEIVANSEDGPKKKHEKLKNALSVCSEALVDPSKWEHHPASGLFIDGLSTADKLNATLRDFDDSAGDFYSSLDKTTVGKAGFLRAFQQLVDARHGVAHALPGVMNPGPKDVQGWVVSSFWFARRIQSHLATLIP